MGDLKPYSEYKNSELPWLAKIPSDWEIMRAKNIFESIDIRSESGNEELLSVSEKYGVTPRKQVNVTMFKAESYLGYKLCWPGDLVINSLWAWMQGLGFSKHHGIVSSAYGVYRLKEPLTSDFKYFDYLLRSKVYLWELRVNSKGIWRSRYQLTDESFFTIPVTIPPEHDRIQIVRFLDWKTSQINKFIKAKKRQIELLKEQKQVIINDAVTGKIDVLTGKLYPKYKDSGVEWLEKLPEDWRMFPIKAIAKSNLKALGEKTNPEYEFDYLEINKVKAGYITDAPIHLRFADAPSRARRVVSYGDTIISTVRTYLRSVYYINSADIKDLIVSTGFCVLTPKTNVFPIYLGYLLRSNYFIDKVIQNSVGVSYPAISDSKLMALKAPLPQITEQKQIVKAIETRTKNINLSIQNLESEITLLQEYQNSLVAGVVTGKIDIRDMLIPEGYNTIDSDSAEEANVEETIEEIPDEEIN